MDDAGLDTATRVVQAVWAASSNGSTYRCMTMRPRRKLGAASLLALATLTAGCGASGTVEVGGPGAAVTATDPAPSSAAGSTTPEASAAATGDASEQPTAVAAATAAPTAAPPAEPAAAVDHGALVRALDDRAYRAEVSLAFALDANPATLVPFVMIEQDGADTSLVMEFDALLESLPTTLTGGGGGLGELPADLGLQMIVVGDTAYLRSSLFALLAGEDPAALGPLAGLTAVADGWGVIDFGALADVAPEEVAGLLGQMGGGMGGSRQQFLALLESASEVVEVGAGEVRGVATTHYEGRVDLGALLESAGVSGMLENADPAVAEDLGRLFAGLSMPFAFDIDGDGLLRRIAYELDVAELVRTAAESAGEPIPADLPAGFAFSTAIEFFDFDDPSIVITEPPPDDVVTDLTDDFAALLDSGLLGG
jgi:hypothetical protein